MLWRSFRSRTLRGLSSFALQSSLRPRLPWSSGNLLFSFPLSLRSPRSLPWLLNHLQIPALVLLPKLILAQIPFYIWIDPPLTTLTTTLTTTEPTKAHVLLMSSLHVGCLNESFHQSLINTRPPALSLLGCKTISDSLTTPTSSGGALLGVYANLKAKFLGTFDGGPCWWAVASSSDCHVNSMAAGKSVGYDVAHRRVDKGCDRWVR